MLTGFFQTMLRNSELGLLMSDGDNLLHFNSSCAKLLGLPGSGKDIVQALRIPKLNDAGSFLAKLGDKEFAVDYLHDNSNSCYIFIIRPSIALLNKKLAIFETLANHVQDALYSMDKDGKELFFNNRIERFEPSSRSSMLKELLDVLSTGKPVIDRYKKYITQDHQDFHCLSTLIPVMLDGKPIAVCSINKNITEMHHLLNKAVDLQNQLQNYSRAKRLSFNGTTYTFKDILGNSNLIHTTITKAKKAAQGQAPVLIYGETGTGKEMFAQSIHNYGPKADEPFVAINCAAMPEPLLEGLLFGTEKGAFTGAEKKAGLLEQAGQGTLFLDEINNMNPLLQAKLLRVLQEMKVRRLGGATENPISCRIISATSVDCNKLLQEKKMREDFYYRIAVIDVTVPSLRERKEDILALTNYFIKHFNRTYGRNIVGVSQELRNILVNHSWPGNIRELRHVIEGAMNIVEAESLLTLDHLPDYFRRQNRGSTGTGQLESSMSTPLTKALEDLERQLILRTLIENNYNVSKAAASLGLQRQNLQTRMKKLSIKRLHPIYGSEFKNS